jgi:hypothetical protein
MSQVSHHPAPSIVNPLNQMLVGSGFRGAGLGWRFSCVCHLSHLPVFVPGRMGRGHKLETFYRAYTIIHVSVHVPVQPTLLITQLLVVRTQSVVLPAAKPA